MKEKINNDDKILFVEGNILDSVRQLLFPHEFRIAAPSLPSGALESLEEDPQATPACQTLAEQSVSHDFLALSQLVTEYATFLWYLKAKHFKREWDDPETSDEDPRVRRTLTRLNKCIEALKEKGIEVQDPTNKRYPQGSEGTMRPLQFLPTAGLTFEMVSETVAPIIYRDEKLIQRGEVFVAVPKEAVGTEENSPATTALSESLAADSLGDNASSGADSLANTSSAKPATDAAE